MRQNPIANSATATTETTTETLAGDQKNRGTMSDLNPTQPKSPYRHYLEAFGIVASGGQIGPCTDEIDEYGVAAIAVGVAHALVSRRSGETNRIPFTATAIARELDTLFFQSQGTTP